MVRAGVGLMSAPLIIYGFPASTFTRTACMVCEEKGVPYQLEAAPLRSPGYRELHPFRKVPSMKHGHIRLFESLAIGAYIDASFEGPPLMPEDPTDRATVLQWYTAIMDTIYPDVVRAFVQREGDPGREIVEAARQRLAVLDRALEGREVLVGDRITLVDLLWLPIVEFVDRNPHGAHLLEELPALSHALHAHRDRPSVVATRPA